PLRKQSSHALHAAAMRREIVGDERDPHLDRGPHPLISMEKSEGERRACAPAEMTTGERAIEDVDRHVEAARCLVLQLHAMPDKALDMPDEVIEANAHAGTDIEDLLLPLERHGLEQGSHRVRHVDVVAYHGAVAPDFDWRVLQGVVQEHGDRALGNVQSLSRAIDI